ncbi:hypothetical protein A3Q56_00201 [Intoshia linei]|uniref:Cytochrome b561 domain-containing protein n=1 Tax=Intoshia linei TaxID=1819745 RepID=A0A177BEK5_9BILA|nr:hypothetical protein A3Q56_00201 [Intoshia linei]
MYKSGVWFLIFIVGLSQAVGIFIIFSSFVWIYNFQNGIHWSIPAERFNIHPVCMLIGMIFLYGDALIVYTIFKNFSRKIVKLVHLILLLLSLLFAVIGCKAVFDFHNYSDPPKKNLYSLHSIIGLSTIILFGVQWICGFALFFLRVSSPYIRILSMPVHKYWGKMIFIMALVATISGLNEKAFFLGNYSVNNTQGKLINTIGYLCVIFVGLIMFILENKQIEYININKNIETESHILESEKYQNNTSFIEENLPVD